MSDESLKHVPQTLLALALASAQEEFTATQARLATATDTCGVRVETCLLRKDAKR